MLNILTIAEQLPGLNLTVKAEDLRCMAHYLIEQTRREVIADRAKDREAAVMSREVVMDKLGVSPSTLWRWEKNGYLCPVDIGGQRRYRVEDVNKILEGK